MNIPNHLCSIVFRLLHSLDPDTATAEQLKEAFCRLVSLLFAVFIQYKRLLFRDIDPEGLKLILAALLKEKQAEEVERNKNAGGGGGWKISGFNVLVIVSIIGLHLFLMVCICCGIKKTCWTCRKARKGFKQVYVAMVPMVAMMEIKSMMSSSWEGLALSKWGKFRWMAK